MATQVLKLTDMYYKHILRLMENIVIMIEQQQQK